MGYWNTNEDGASLLPGDTGMIWGDAPADIVDDMLDKIVEVFTRDVGRQPRKAEILAGIKFSLAIYDETMERQV